MAMCQPAVMVAVTNLLSLLLPPWSKPHLCAAIVWKRKLLLPIASVIPVMLARSTFWVFQNILNTEFEDRGALWKLCTGSVSPLELLSQNVSKCSKAQMQISWQPCSCVRICRYYWPFCLGNVFFQLLYTCPLPPSYMLPNIFPQLQIWGLDFYMVP